MSSRAFISSPLPQDLLVTETPAGVDVAVASRSIVWVVLVFFVLFPLALLPVALYAYNINHTGQGLQPVDIAGLWSDPSAFIAALPDNKTFMIYAALPWVLAVLFFSKHVYRTLRRPRMTVRAEGVMLVSSFSAQRVDLAEVAEVQIRDYMSARGYTPQLAQFVVLPAGEGIFDFLAGVEKSDAEGLRRLTIIAEAMGRLHNKPVKRFDAEGKEETKP